MGASGLSMEEQGRLDQEASKAIAAELAPMLGPGWRVEMPRQDYAYWAELVHANGMRVSVRCGGWHNAGRVTFTPQWPTYADGRKYTTPDRYRAVEWRPGGGGWTRGWSHPRDENASSWSITCSQKRTPKAMASELARRLLPAYETMHAVAVVETRATDGHTAEADIVADRLAAVAGGHVSGNARKRTGEQVYVYVPHSSIYRMKVTPQYESLSQERPCSVDLELHGLDPETAAQVLALIREAEQRAEEVQGEAARARAAELEEPAPAVRIGPVDEESEPESEPLERAATAMS
jgi:hypothetical protein